MTGAGTALIAIFAFFPAGAMPTIVKLPYLIEYTIIIQHWGIMVGLVLANARQPFAAGFCVPFVLDFTVVAYTIGHFAFCGFNLPARGQPLQRG